MTTKSCTKCKQERDLSEFYADKRNKDGLRSHCKVCCIEYRSRRFREHLTDEAEYYRLYWADKKELRLALARKYYANHREKNRARARAYHAAHRAENKQRNRAYYAANREHERQRVLKWHRDHPEEHRAAEARRRARKIAAGGEHSAEDIKRQGQSQKWRCWWCGKKCEKKYHVDHLVPLSRGGHNAPSNLVITCPKCNLSKHDNLPEEWAGKLF